MAISKPAGIYLVYHSFYESVHLYPKYYWDVDWHELLGNKGNVLRLVYLCIKLLKNRIVRVTFYSNCMKKVSGACLSWLLHDNCQLTLHGLTVRNWFSETSWEKWADSMDCAVPQYLSQLLLSQSSYHTLVTTNLHRNLATKHNFSSRLKLDKLLPDKKKKKKFVITVLLTQLSFLNPVFEMYPKLYNLLLY